MDKSHDPRRIWLAAVDFRSGDERFATQAFAIDADTQLAAHRRALELAGDSVYADPRVPELTWVVRSVERADRVVDAKTLTTLLAQARDALSCCLDDLDSWASTSPKGYMADEQQRRDRYDVVLERIDAAL